MRTINDYTIVVQEYFHVKVQAWIETVGKEIFGIKYHWLRYEFAPSRGQIHAHMLVICDNIDVQKNGHELKDKQDELAYYLSTWSHNSIGMTATVNDKGNKEEYHPSCCYFKDIEETKRSSDAQKCLETFQFHKCNNFCLKRRSVHKKEESKED